MSNSTRLFLIIIFCIQLTTAILIIGQLANLNSFDKFQIAASTPVQASSPYQIQELPTIPNAQTSAQNVSSQYSISPDHSSANADENPFGYPIETPSSKAIVSEFAETKPISTLENDFSKLAPSPVERTSLLANAQAEGVSSDVSIFVRPTSTTTPEVSPTLSSESPTPTSTAIGMGVNRTPPPDGVWSMAAANPQRTSWVSGEGNEIKGNLKVAWYRVFDPYIDNKVQAIVSEDKVFVSTSKGLYAFNTANGTQAWVYGTEMPLGNSPTYFDGTLYVGGYDHRIHAITASNGQKKAGWMFLEAGAGYETNPLVVKDSFTGNQPVVFAGNRDGYFYAIDGNNGSLKWKYQTDGPIRFSAAYKNGVVYFAADDSYAYALNATNGALVWKSAKMPGAGFDNYWPVIYTDPTSGKDYVILSGSKKADWAWFGWQSSLYFSENYAMYETQAGCTGSITLNCSVISNYMAANPWKRHLFILDRNTGVEYTPYAPINWAGVTHNGNKHPPIVSGGGLYSFIGYNNGGNNGANGWIARWQLGSASIQKIYNHLSGAADEPVTFTAAGNLIYWGEGVNADPWGTIDLTKSIGSNVYTWQDLRSLPGAGEKYTSLDLTGKFGGNNGVYGYFDGLNNLSPIPYKNKIYVINGNALFALGTTGNATQLAKVQVPASQVSGTLSLTPEDIQQRLTNEIQKILAAGHLRPGYADSGIPSGYFNFHGNEASVPGNHIGEYFHNPADTLYTLSIALPYLSPSLQTQVKDYLQQEQINYPVQTIAHIGWKNGSPRETFIDPPEMTTVFSTVISSNGNNVFYAAPRTSIWYPNPCCNEYIDMGSFPQDSFYGAWKYAQVFPAQAKILFDNMKGKLQKAGNGNDLTDPVLITYPYILNQYIAGYRGYLELEKLAGYTTEISQSTQHQEYLRLVNLRINNFSKEAPLWTGENYNNNLNVARNFMFLVPELADALQTNRLIQVQQALTEYQTIEAYWFVSRYDRTFNEGVFQPLYDYHALFQARAYILDLPFSELVKYLDVPAFEKGDLYYIQNLVALLQSPGSSYAALSSEASGQSGE